MNPREIVLELQKIGKTLESLVPSTFGRPFPEIGRTTLTATSDSISVQNLPSVTNLFFVFYCYNSGQLQVQVRFNGDTGANYATRYLADGTAGSYTGGGGLAHFGTASEPLSGHGSIYGNIANHAKLARIFGIRPGAAGAGNIDSWTEFYAKWHNTSDQINRIDLVNSGTGDFAAGSYLIVYGWN